MRNTPAEGNLHAKTGTTNDVVALAGYVTAVNGEVLAFSFLYNGRDRWTAKSMIDVMSESLASFGDKPLKNIYLRVQKDARGWHLSLV